MYRVALLVGMLILGWSGCDSAPQGRMSEEDRAHIRREIQAVMAAQVAGWNEGDIARFMEGYARSDSIRFASGGTVTYGWQTVYERYRRRYATREAMGRLIFSDLDVQVLCPDAAIVFGRWELQRAEDRPGGLFTLLFRKTPAGWRIVHDHTSAASAR